MPDSASPSALFLAHLPEGQSFETYILEFPGGAVGQGSGVVTTVAQVTAMVRVRSLARELLHAAGTARKKKKKRRKLYLPVLRLDPLADSCL